MGMESFRGTKPVEKPKEETKDTLQGYVDIAEQQKEDRERPRPKLSKVEERKIREQINDLTSNMKDEINGHNIIAKRDGTDFEKSAFLKREADIRAEIDKLENILSHSELER
jgi:hypothetical protein